MFVEFLPVADRLFTGAILFWLVFRLIKHVDRMDVMIDDHEARLRLAEKELDTGRKH